MLTGTPADSEDGRSGACIPRCFALAAFVAATLCGHAVGADFKIGLSVHAGKIQQSTDSGQRTAREPALTVHFGETLLVQWSADNPGTELADITLHVFMDRQSATGPVQAPKPSSDATYESAVVLDFQPGAKSTGEFRMPVPEPGVYLLRVETIGVSKKLGREYFAAIEVSVL